MSFKAFCNGILPRALIPAPSPAFPFLSLPLYVQDCAELVRSLLPYSERHFQRLDHLLQSSYLVEYTVISM